MKSLKKAIISFLKGFKYAYDGIIYNIKGERNMRVHICIMILVIAFGLVFNISKFEWIICIILFGLVLEKYIAAGHSKDSAAGAVLILAIAAAIIGLMIFIPQILSVLGR